MVHLVRGEPGAGQLEHHVVEEPVADAGPHVDVLDAARREEAEGVDDVDEVVRLLADDYKHNECIDFALDALGYVAATEAGVLKPSATWRHSACCR